MLPLVTVVKSIISFPETKSVIVSAVASVIPVSPLLNTKVSCLLPPVRVSAPARPSIVSAPSSPMRVSAFIDPRSVAYTLPSIVIFSNDLRFTSIPS